MLGIRAFRVAVHAGNYWTNYFPAFSWCLGFGLSVTVAPLTTVVMDSVDQDRSGSAWGINNAVARVAGVLAIAVLGIIMVHAFGSRLEHRIEKLGLPDPAVREINRKSLDLAALESPAELNEPQKKAVREAVQESFVFGFRVVTLICLALAVMSAGMAGVMIRLPRPSEARTGHP